MFVYTAKCSPKKLGLILIALIAAVLLLVLICAGGSGKKELKAATEEQRIAYLHSFGWEVTQPALEEQEVLIPKTLDGVYADYASLQKSQGFHLERYCGMDAVRYTYTVENYPDAPGTVVADLLVCDDVIIAGDLQCVSLDGFMQPLDPKLSQQSLS